MIPIIIYTYSFNEGSGGIKVMHKLCELLRKNGFESYLYINWGTNAHNPEYDTIEVTQEIMDNIRNCIVLYPEGVWGNPLNAKHVVRWILNFVDLGVCKSWLRSDVVFFYMDFYFNEHIGHEKRILNVIDFHEKDFINLNLPRKGTCYTIRKGVDNPDWYIHPPDSIEITKEMCSDRERLVDLFNTTETFYSYDDHTFLSVQAAMCGCNSVVVPTPNDKTAIAKDRWLNGYKFHQYGIAYDIEDLPRAKETLPLLNEQIEKAKIEINKNVIEFANYCQDHFKMNNKKNIVVAQFYTDNVDHGIYAEKINEKYCIEKGYTYYCEKNTDKIKSALGSRAATWYKPKLIKEVLEIYKPDYVLFLDIDAVVSDESQLIEDFIDENYDFILAEDVGDHSLGNAGVLLFKNSNWTKDFLEKWWESADIFTGGDSTNLPILEQNLDKVGYFREALWHDQTCITILYNKNEDYKNHIKVISNRSFNYREYNQGNFIFHAFAYGTVPYRKLDLIYREKQNTNTGLPIINLIVYHIYCVKNYLEIVKKQLERLQNSGLYDWCDVFEVTCINTEGSFDEIEKLLELFPKAKLNKFDKNDYELEGIRKVWEYSNQYDGKVFYFHTKGVSNDYVNLETKEVSERKVRGISWWKEIMEYYLIDNYKECIQQTSIHDQCGVTNVNGWWWGNFWWSKLSWCRVNPEPTPGSRWNFEGWLNQNRNPNIHEFYHFEFNPYYTYLPNDIYTNKEKYKDAEIELISAYYGTLGEQQDEGKPLIERTVIDVTDIMQSNLEHLAKRGFSMYVSNAIKEDPIYGFVKMLEVNFKLNGEEYTIAAEEGRHLNFIL